MMPFQSGPSSTLHAKIKTKTYVPTSALQNKAGPVLLQKSVKNELESEFHRLGTARQAPAERASFGVTGTTHTTFPTKTVLGSADSPVAGLLRASPNNE